MEFLAGIEGSTAVEALKSSFYVYPLVNAAHIFCIGALVALVLLIDMRLLGAFAELERERFVARLRTLALAAFSGAALTGLALFSIRATEYAENPAFLAKLGLLLLAGLNFMFFARSGAPPRPALLASMLLWPATLVAGRFIGFI